jgi:hypothetical protein
MPTDINLPIKLMKSRQHIIRMNTRCFFKDCHNVKNLDEIVFSLNKSRGLPAILCAAHTKGVYN